MIAYILLPVLSLSAQAALRISDIPNESVVNHQVRGRRAEVCIMPKHLPGADYAKKDQAKEAELCALEADLNAALCPKVSSTNPGLIFFTPPEGMSIAELKAKDCDVKEAKKAGKFKLSTACSYSPSIVSYYHVSRALGNIANVPAAVLRTMDLQRHLELGNRAVNLMTQKKLLNDAIYRKWSILLEDLRAGRAGKNAPLLFTDGFDQSYGALLAHSKKTKLYREFYNGGVDLVRVQLFMQKNAIYANLKNPALKPGRDFTLENVQMLRQMKDMADMLVIDTILGQQDRFGNTNFKEKFYYQVTNADGSTAVSTKGDLEEVPQELQAKALTVKELVMEDNDCGVAKDHVVKKMKILDPVEHIDPKTYRSLLKFNKWFAENKAAAQEFFVRGMNYTDWDFRVLGINLKETTDMLRSRCQQGRLKLDLDQDLHFSGKALPTVYDCGN